MQVLIGDDVSQQWVAVVEADGPAAAMHAYVLQHADGSVFWHEHDSRADVRDADGDLLHALYAVGVAGVAHKRMTNRGVRVEVTMPDGRVDGLGGNRAARAEAVLVELRPVYRDGRKTSEARWHALGCRADVEQAKREAARLSTDRTVKGRGYQYDVSGRLTLVYVVEHEGAEQ